MRTRGKFGRLRALTQAGTVLAVATAFTLAPKAPAAVPRPQPAAPTAFTFAAGGDMGYSPDAAATVRGIAAAGVDFSVHLGDMAYDGIYPESAWCDFVKDPRGGVGPDFPYQIVAGGHDLGKGPGPAAQYRTLIDEYVKCLPDRMGSTGTYGKEYFFDHPAAAPLMRVIMISPSITMPDGTLYDYRPGTPNWAWLVHAIDSARAAGIRWLAVGMARNCIATGEKDCEIGQELFNLLLDKRVDLILQGHEHGYMRSRQLATSPTCPGLPVNRVEAACIADSDTSGYTKGAGSVVVVAGTLGIGLRPVDTRDSEAGYFVTMMGSNLNPTKGFMKFTVNQERIQAQFVKTANRGTFGDQFEIIDPQPATPTPPPTFVTPATLPPAQPAPASGPVTATGVPAGAPRHAGYWMLAADGTVFPFGEARHYGNAPPPPGFRAVDLEPTPSGQGYWVLDGSGAVRAYGDATAFGGVASAVLVPGEAPTSLSAVPSGAGYWVFTNRGRAVAFGAAAFHGDVSTLTLNGPVLDSVATPTGLGYYMVASDGGIFAFGDATFAGSMGDRSLNAPVQSLVPDGDSRGYWLVASDGGIFAFDSPFQGSMGSEPLARPVTGMVRYGDGYLMVGEDGGVFNFSDRPFAGSLGDRPPAEAVVAVAALH